MSQTVIGVFDTHANAVEAVHELRREGFQPSQISIFAPDPREAEGYPDELGVSVVQAGTAGAAAGGLLGGLGGWLVGLTGLLVPGAGLVIAAGPLAGAIVGLIGGATVGGFIGTLVGLGMPHHAAEEYNRELMAGRTLVIVHPNADYALAEAALGRAHPRGIHRYDEYFGAPPEATQRPAVARPVHAPARPTEHVEPAAPDASLRPSDVAESIEGQRVMGHTQYLDEADLHPTGGAKDT